MIVISHAKLQISVWMFVSGWKWSSGIKDGPLPSYAVLWVASVRETKTQIEKKSFWKGSSVQHMLAFSFVIWYTRNFKLCFQASFPDKQHNSPFCCVIIKLVGKAQELKYQQFCFHSGIWCKISQIELHSPYNLDLAYSFFQFC